MVPKAGLWGSQSVRCASALHSIIFIALRPIHFLWLHIATKIYQELMEVKLPYFPKFSYGAMPAVHNLFSFARSYKNTVCICSSSKKKKPNRSRPSEAILSLHCQSRAPFSFAYSFTPCNEQPQFPYASVPCLKQVSWLNATRDFSER